MNKINDFFGNSNQIKKPLTIWFWSVCVFFFVLLFINVESPSFLILAGILVAAFSAGVIAFLLAVIRILKYLFSNEAFKKGLEIILTYTFWFFVAAILLRSCNSDSGRYSGRRYYDEIEYYDYDKPVTSENWNCTHDCSGHEAGYEWAEDKGITDPDDCGGNSDSFIEGCEAYANEYNLEYDEYYYEEDYDYWY